VAYGTRSTTTCFRHYARLAPTVPRLVDAMAVPDVRLWLASHQGSLPESALNGAATRFVESQLTFRVSSAMYERRPARGRTDTTAGMARGTRESGPSPGDALVMIRRRRMALVGVPQADEIDKPFAGWRPAQ